MLSGFLSDAMNFQNVEGSFGQNVLLSAVLQYCSCRSIFRLCSDNAVEMVQSQLRNNGYNTFVS